MPARTPPVPTVDLARADLLLAVFAVALAFLAASTAARNSDVWLHLATGRAIADGSYRFHGDPFGGDSTAWIAHSWLYDLIGYEFYQWLGGNALVILKAALVGLLAVVLIRLGKRGRGLAWPALCATLSVLALSGRLLLQPALLSTLLLAVTLCLLERARLHRAEGKSNWLRDYGPICLLFALWANLDIWFVLGPLTVGLYLLGEVLAVSWRSGEQDPTDLPGLGLLLAAGLLACLLNPFHVRIFALPPELGLSATAQALERDPVLEGLFLSPFERTYFRVGAAWSVPGVAYLVLAALSLLSFAGSREGWRSWRLPVWLGFFALSAWSVRAVPFFAVVAGPILALNLRDFMGRFDAVPSRRGQQAWTRLARAAAILLLFGLLVATWPGFLQGKPYEMRRWVVLADPSLREAADQLALWRKDGSLSAKERGFNFAPESANYFAWFCPTEKGILDSELQLSASEAADYVTVRRALLDGPTSKSDWRRILRDRRVNRVVLYDSNPERVQTVYRRLVRNEREWPLLFLAGRTAVFGWVDPAHAESSTVAELRLRPDREAYHPLDNKQAPLERPGRGPQPSPWWDAFTTVRPAGTIDRDEAALLLIHFETLRESTLADRGAAWEASRIAGAIGAGGGTLSVRLQQALDLYCVQLLHSDEPLTLNNRTPNLEYVALGLRANFFRERDDAPVELLWLAIRAGRRAVRDNPNDAHAYLILGEAYLRLARNTRERVWKNSLPFLSRLRSVQASAAFNQALLLQPDLIAAHAGLVALYQDMGQWDLRLRHLKEVLRLTQARGAALRESRPQWEERLARLKEEVQHLDEELRRILDNYEVNAGNLKIIDRVKTARDRGLGGKALELLLSSDAASFGEHGIQWELNLLLSTGRVRDVRAWLLPEHIETLGKETYLQVRLELAAACGDYEQADAELADLTAAYGRLLDFNGVKMPFRPAMCFGIGRMILDGRLQNESLIQLFAVPLNRSNFLRYIDNFAGVLQKEAEAAVLRGLLALESGETMRAREFFSRALEVYKSKEAAASGGGLEFGGRPIAEYYLERLSSPPR